MATTKSPGAALRALRKTYSVTCLVCGATKIVSDSRGKYCSNRCKQAAKYTRGKSERPKP